MQQQNNYSKLRYSNSVYNKGARRGYKRASKVPVGTSKFYLKNSRIPVQNLFWIIFFWKTKEDF